MRCYEKLYHVSTIYAILGPVRIDEVRLGQVCPVYVMCEDIWSG